MTSSSSWPALERFSRRSLGAQKTVALTVAEAQAGAQTTGMAGGALPAPSSS